MSQFPHQTVVVTEIVVVRAAVVISSFQLGQRMTGSRINKTRFLYPTVVINEVVVVVSGKQNKISDSKLSSKAQSSSESQ